MNEQGLAVGGTRGILNEWFTTTFTLLLLLLLLLLSYSSYSPFLAFTIWTSSIVIHGVNSTSAHPTMRASPVALPYARCKLHLAFGIQAQKKLSNWMAKLWKSLKFFYIVLQYHLKYKMVL